MIKTLPQNNIIDAVAESYIHLRVRVLGPKALAEAEKVALQLESHKIAENKSMYTTGLILNATKCIQISLNERTSDTLIGYMPIFQMLPKTY